jgi:hypothetical protein
VSPEDTWYHIYQSAGLALHQTWYLKLLKFSHSVWTVKSPTSYSLQCVFKCPCYSSFCTIIFNLLTDEYFLPHQLLYVRRMVHILWIFVSRWQSMFNLSLTINISSETLNKIKENCIVYRLGYPGCRRQRYRVIRLITFVILGTECVNNAKCCSFFLRIFITKISCPRWSSGYHACHWTQGSRVQT